MIELQYQELDIKDEEMYPNYNKMIKDFMSDKNKELEFRSFIKNEREKECKI